MSLLCVTVRRARLAGYGGQYNSYVTLKLQNVKSTTVAVKGNNPSWEQDFMFETNRMDTGLIIEVWNKGMLWDKLMGSQWLPLMSVQYSNEVGEGQWLSLDAELVMNEGDIIGTKTPTGHSILVEAHFELPFDLEGTDSPELQHKLEILNRLMDEKLEAMREHQPQVSYQLNSTVSEDSDYTSDVGYPANQHPSASIHHPNSSASQFGGASNLVRRASQCDDFSFDREGSYELDNYDEDMYDERVSQSKGGDIWMKGSDSESDPLYYNSRPPERYMQKERNSSPSASRRWGMYGYSNGPDYESDQSFSFDADDHLVYNEYDRSTDDVVPNTPRDIGRRKSLERQGGFDQEILNELYEEPEVGYHSPDSSDAYRQDSAESANVPEWRGVMNDSSRPSWDQEFHSFETKESGSPVPEQWSSVEQPFIPEHSSPGTLEEPDEVSPEEEEEQEDTDNITLIETDSRPEGEMMSKAKVRWLTAFHKIIDQLNESCTITSTAVVQCGLHCEKGSN
ncbi:uncharacterized protein LOC143239442 [Tachypleus tridentatus]|uniref:uncharacterized protein LOC143239442 n=1 Tax=Tachypleus tridentatus TaxID=6853 RepID=UPI003FCFF366